MPLAFMIIYRAAVIEKNLSDIWKSVIIGWLIICAVIFVIAPNLFTDFCRVYSTVLKEARPNHLGADGLGFAGNLIFYLRNAIENLGWESALLACLGIYTILKSCQRVALFSVGIGIVYWIFISVLSLHWLRWGIPFFFYYDMAVAIGIGKVADFLVNNSACKKTINYIACAILSLLSILVLFNVFISGIAITRFSLLTDTRVAALEWCNRNGITKSNTLYEIYTPFAPSEGGWNVIIKLFELKKNKLVLKDKLKSKKYVMFSSSFRNRFLREKKRYIKEVKILKIIEKKYPLLYKMTADGNYSNDESFSDAKCLQKKSAIENISFSLRYLFRESKLSGNTIYIYKL